MVEASVINETTKLISALIDKPKMTEKYLVKPPPTYIFDIVCNVNSKFGFPGRILTEEQYSKDHFKAVFV